MKARVHISFKNGVLDPQGRAIGLTLKNLGFDGVVGVRQGKLIEIELTETDIEKARNSVSEMCEQLLANTVIENYEIVLEDD